MEDEVTDLRWIVLHMIEEQPGTPVTSTLPGNCSTGKWDSDPAKPNPRGSSGRRR